MERFWRNLREGCLDHLGDVGSVGDINQRLATFLERHYHPAPHAGLKGRAPSSVYALSTRAPNHVDETQLREALAVREWRCVRRDTTVSILGGIYELEQGFLAGRVVDVVYSHSTTRLSQRSSTRASGTCSRLWTRCALSVGQSVAAFPRAGWTARAREST